MELDPSAQLEFPRRRIKRFPFGGQARDRLRLFIALDQVTVDVRRDIIVRRQVVIVGVDRRDIGAEANGQVGGDRGERDAERAETGQEAEHGKHGYYLGIARPVMKHRTIACRCLSEE